MCRTFIDGDCGLESAILIAEKESYVVTACSHQIGPAVAIEITYNKIHREGKGRGCLEGPILVSQEHVYRLRTTEEAGADAKSGLPSPLKSPTLIERGGPPLVVVG